ncbi:hypothetical protein TBR22_A41750 [Luteitalea sp. TBR-22]|uniref:DUF3300 domain-containing protein n=1 Tax=Luteitalea sp. TBR-22 TaxID=2802971 RepID=UPI001AF7B836|nr:DUF3300 domain-containing protein [Luteitalea sp. TBR-22]BCS34949.1 hypothetical protein TBR22_A41750 [Luteitalea sp. TBR-22]
MRALARVVVILVIAGSLSWEGMAIAAPLQAPSAAAAPATRPATPQELDGLLAPVALYPDQLLAQMLLCAQTPPKVQEFSGWLVRNAALEGTALQDKAKADGFAPSFVVLAIFPQVINFMADNIAWTRQLGAAFTADKAAVFASIQRLRAASQKAGTLTSTPQQKVETTTTKAGEQVIVIEPANPQIVYVPQYNPQVVYGQPVATTTTVVVKEDNSTTAAVTGAVVGFAAGIAIGAAIDNDYYYGPYGWHGGAHMYNDAWDDFYDDREDAREDWYENREDAREDISENREDARENANERRESTANQRTERQAQRQTPEAQAQRQERADTARTNAQSAGATTASRGTTSSQRSTVDRSGMKSDAFSGYSSGRSERAASARGSRSRASSRSGGGGRRR